MASSSAASGGIINNNGNNNTESIAEEEGRYYNPFAEYKGTSFDQRSINALYQLPSSPQYLFPEEAAVKHRNWSENLTYYTGCGYLAGSLTGGALGLRDGLRAAEADDTLKLRVNRLLNASGHRGRTYGNKMGVVGLLYAGLESGLTHQRGTDDLLNSVVAGLGTGALFRVSAGPRAAAFAGALGGIAAATAAAGKLVFKRYLVI